MDSTRDDAHLAEAKRTVAAELRRIAKTIQVHADRVLLISHASWLESEAVALEKNAAAGPGQLLTLRGGSGNMLAAKETKAA